MTKERTAREEVWMAMSELFLDTDITSSFDYITRVLAASPYDLSELDRILLEEVYPVCIPNLHSVAGVWSGFDEDWLFEQVTRHKSKSFPLLWLWMPMRKRHFRRMVPEWPALRKRIAAKRDESIPR